MQVLGAHSVACKTLWAIARVRGIISCIMALALGIWILLQHERLGRTPAGQVIFETVNGRIDLIGWPILIGGVCGITGLLVREKIISVISCAICIGWFGWVGALLWYADFTGNASSIAAFFCIYGLLEYVYRFILLVAPIGPREGYGKGW